jgi:hypothetical protein
MIAVAYENMEERVHEGCTNENNSFKFHRSHLGKKASRRPHLNEVEDKRLRLEHSTTPLLRSLSIRISALSLL